jgi:hypothetical protein
MTYGKPVTALFKMYASRLSSGWTPLMSDGTAHGRWIPS